MAPLSLSQRPLPSLFALYNKEMPDQRQATENCDHNKVWERIILTIDHGIGLEQITA